VKMKNVLVKNKETFIDSVNQYSILASLIEWSWFQFTTTVSFFDLELYLASTTFDWSWKAQI
jgi:hypothetical protein